MEGIAQTALMVTTALARQALTAPTVKSVCTNPALIIVS